MRFAVMLAALAIACSPTPPAPTGPAETMTPPPAPVAANADALALQRAPAEGSWTYRSSSGRSATRYFEPQIGDVLTIRCATGNGVLSLELNLALKSESATSLRIVTTTRALDLPATSRFAGDVGAFIAEIADDTPEHDALISTLGTPGDRFAVDAGGVVTVLPWDDSIAQTLIACRRE